MSKKQKAGVTRQVFALRREGHRYAAPYLDGRRAEGNTGVGGWGVLMLWGSQKKELYGGARQTTNNRMELTAVISALSSLKRRVPVVIHSYGQHVCPQRHCCLDS